MILAIRDVYSYYGAICALRGVSLDVTEGEIVALIGANGAGKSTLLMTLCGVVRARRGSITFDGRDITRTATEKIIRSGIAVAPEGRRIFPHLTVRENLQMGGLAAPNVDMGADTGAGKGTGKGTGKGVGRATGKRAANAAHMAHKMEGVLELFPRLRERLGQRGGTLSGGEQQMLAIARAMLSEPRLLLLDEPSLGLAPLMVKQIFTTIREINRSHGTTVLLVEQNAHQALRLAHHGYVMVTGEVVLHGTGKELLANEEVQAAYLEGGRKEATQQQA